MTQHELPSTAKPLSRGLGSLARHRLPGSWFKPGRPRGDAPRGPDPLGDFQAGAGEEAVLAIRNRPGRGLRTAVVPQPRRRSGHGFAAASAPGSRADRRTGPRPGADAAVGPADD